MNMTKMKTAELSGAYLSLFVAKALGYKDCFINLQGDCVQAYTKNGITQYREIRFDNKPDVVLKVVKDSKLSPAWDRLLKCWYVDIEPWQSDRMFPRELFLSDNIEILILRAFVYTRFGNNIEIDL